MLKMNQDEYNAATAAERQNYERETQELATRLGKAREKVISLEKLLADINERYLQSLSQLNAMLLGLPVSEPATQPSAKLPGARRRAGKNVRRSRDRALLELAKEIAKPDVSVRELKAGWNQRKPEDQITESTIRGILTRLERDGYFVVSKLGGGKGSGIGTRYSPTDKDPSNL